MTISEKDAVDGPILPAAEIRRVGIQAVASIGAGHMLDDGGLACADGWRRAGLVKYLDGLAGDADIDEFADQPEQRRIPVAVKLDMLVRRDAAALPACEHIRVMRHLASLGMSNVARCGYR